MVGDVPGWIFGTHHEHGLYCQNDSLFGIKLKNSTIVNINGNGGITTGKRSCNSNVFSSEASELYDLIRKRPLIVDSLLLY